MDRAAESAEGARQRPLWSGYPNRRARIVGTVFTGVWLLYLVQPIWDLLTGHYSVPYAVGETAILTAFAVIYMLLVPNWPIKQRPALPGLAALAVLAAVACVLYVGMAGIWTYVAVASGLLVRDRRRAVQAVFGSIACYLLFAEIEHLDSSTFLSNLVPVVFIGFAMIGLRRLVELTAELAQAREEVAQLAANSERLRLARDMHDLTGQSLSMITLKSELAARLLGRLPDNPDKDRARDEVEQIAAVSRQTLRDIREAISGYRRPTLAVEIITARAALSSAGVVAHDDPGLTLLSGTFDPDAEAALAWSLREAVTNVVRHSGAKNCHISLESAPESMSLTVRDDGAGLAAPDGCDSESVPGGPLPQSSGGLGSGSGLHGIAERLSAVGGSLEIRPDTRPGFFLIATVPTAPRTAPEAEVASSTA